MFNFCTLSDQKLTPSSKSAQNHASILRGCMYNTEEMRRLCIVLKLS